MERGEWENDPDYPRAPVPPHERTWRHPSEIGQTQWARSEPPLVVGRGLSIATGTVGALLALGLLWLMIPHSDRGGVAVESSSPLLVRPPRSSASLLDVESSAPSGTAVASTLVDTTDASVPPATTAAPTSAAPSTTPRTIPSTTVPGIEVESTTVTEKIPTIAVALMPGHLVVTTAAAVAGRTEIPITLSTGDTVKGSVVSVDSASGTAVLSIPVEIANPQIAPTAQDAPTEGVVKGTDATMWDDDEGTQLSYDETAKPDEGSLVLDHDGKLIGMCTKSSKGFRVVGVQNLMDAVNMATVKEASAWLGVEVQVIDPGVISVSNIVADGPAGPAGVQLGDVLTAIDGVAVTDLETLRAKIVTHAAGQTVTLSVVHPGATTPTDITITLGKRPWNL